MAFPMFLLGLCSIFAGFFFSEAFNGVATPFFNNSIYLAVNNYIAFDAEFSLFFIKFMPLIISLLGVSLFFVVANYNYAFILLFRYSFVLHIHRFFTRAMYFDIFFIDTFFVYLLRFSYTGVYKYIEKRMLEFFCIFYIFSIMNRIYSSIKVYQVGLVFNFVFLIIFFFIYFFLIFEFTFYFNYIFLLILFIFFVFNLSI